MMSNGDEPRPGTGADLSRRMDRMEQKYDDLTGEVGSLKATLARVEVAQLHAVETNDLRFKALDLAIGSVGSKLDAFISRVDGIITGEIQTAQTRQGAEMVADYMRWRKGVDDRLAVVWPEGKKKEIEDRLDQHDKFEVQARLLGRLVVVLVGSNGLAIIAAVYALVK